MTHPDSFEVPRAPGNLTRQAATPDLRPELVDQPDVGVVIVAAGSGSRTGSRELKQFRWVAGKPMLLHSIQAFHRRRDVALVVAVLPRSFAGDPPPWIFQCDIDRLLVSVGGRQRSDSVWSGIEDLPEEVRVVVVHDAARPLVTDATIDAVIARARAGRGAVAALPVVDTLKEVDADGRIVRTIDRATLWRAQTPQAFPREMIERAYLQAIRDGIVATDDAALCERLQLEVTVVPGSERALKVTEESDFARADRLARLEG
ncbi:MAG: 2-C-methyl-D-erythritol 4-phosphate cytidylyltransferase [Gemmatimonadaceae bacterium]|nr:2-C-methyl-D-erythritol 4-phosphate cytidylyltransferase [Gemmatimonadaceae bacterium]